MESGTDWAAIINPIFQGMVALLTVWIGYQQARTQRKVDTVAEKTEIVKTEVTETKVQVAATQDQVIENMRRLDGRLTLLLEETDKRARAEGKAEATAEANERAKVLIEENRIALEKLVKDKAEAEALVLKTAGEANALPAATAAATLAAAPAAAAVEDAAQVVRIAADIVAATAKQVTANLTTSDPVPVSIEDIDESVAAQIAGHVRQPDVPAQSRREQEILKKHADEQKKERKPS